MTLPRAPMFALLVAVFHLSHRTSDAHTAVVGACIDDRLTLLQHDQRIQVRQAHAGDNKGDDKGNQSRRPRSGPALLGKHGLHGRLSAEETGVPDIIYMTGPYMPKDIVRNNLDFVNAGTEFRYFSNDQMEASTKSIDGKLSGVGVHGAYEAFRMLRPMAFRADLWRLMVLWDTGGYYLDAKMALRVHISNFVDRNNDGAFAACLEDMQSSVWAGSRKAYWSGVLAARPKDKLVLAMIRLIIKNVEARDYGRSLPGPLLQITGPGILTRAMESANFTPHVHCRFEHVDHDMKRARVVTNSGTILLDAVEEVHSRMHEGGCSNCSYNKLYYAHAVFCDEPAKVPADEDPCLRKSVQSVKGRKYWSKKVTGARPLLAHFAKALRHVTGRDHSDLAGAVEHKESRGERKRRQREEQDAERRQREEALHEEERRLALEAHLQEEGRRYEEFRQSKQRKMKQRADNYKAGEHEGTHRA